MTGDHRVDPEAGDGLPTPIEKDVVRRRATGDQGFQVGDRLRPEGTAAQLVAFAAQPDRGVIPGAGGQIQVPDQQLGGFIGSGPGVV
jgi:hypothetical protein